MRRKSHYALNLLLLFLVLLLMAELFLPRLAEKRLAAILSEETAGFAELRLGIRAFPAIKILLGKLDQVDVEANMVQVADLNLDFLKLTYRDVILREGFFTGENSYLQIIVSEDSLNQYLQDNYPELNRFSLSLLPQQVLLKGAVKFFETDINLQLSGQLSLTEEEEIVFLPRDFQVEDIKISTALISGLIDQLGFTFDFKELDFPLEIDQIEVQEGFIELKGDYSLRKAGS